MNQLCANWKRLVAAMLAIFAALGMTACGKQNQDNTPPAQKEQTSQNGDSTKQDGADEEFDPWVGWPDFGEEGVVLPDDVWD